MIERKFLIKILILFLITACGQQKKETLALPDPTTDLSTNPSDPTTDLSTNPSDPTTDLSTNPSDPTTYPSPFISLRSQYPEEEVSTLKNSFLSTTKIQQLTGIGRYHSSNTTRLTNRVRSPVVHSYHGTSPLVPLIIQFPHYFLFKIQEKIEKFFSGYNIHQIDLFFTPQENLRLPEVGSLKAGFWMFPNLPALDAILGAPPEYQKNILLGIFDSDVSIDDQVVSNQLKEFSVSFHDTLISPDTGHLRTSEYIHSFSFYSLAIFKEQHRAAVTLHWMLSETDRVFLTLVLAEMVRDPTHDLNTFITRLQANDSPFRGAPLLNKLIDLTNI